MSYVYTNTTTSPFTTPITYPNLDISTVPTTGIGINWGDIGTYTNTTDPNLKGTTLKVKGDADFEGDLKLQGKSLKNSLEAIEERLAILRPNEALENKWDNLRELRKQYIELEAEIIEKEKMWSILKK